MGNTIQTQTDQIYILAPTGCTEAQALAALYALFFLPMHYRIVLAPNAELETLADELKFGNRAIFTENPDQYAPLTDICEESPEAFASQALAKLR